jgi:hypothetical protein
MENTVDPSCTCRWPSITGLTVDTSSHVLDSIELWATYETEKSTHINNHDPYWYSPLFFDVAMTTQLPALTPSHGHSAKSNFLFFWFGRAPVDSVPGLAGYGGDILCWCTYEAMGDGSRWQPNQQTKAACWFNNTPLISYTNQGAFQPPPPPSKTE